MNVFFVMDNLSNSEISYDLIKNINEEKYMSCNIYFQNHVPSIIEPECLTFNITGLSSARGTAVAFDLASAAAINNVNANTKNILYLYSLEWLYQPMNYMLVKEILSKFKIYCRSEYYIPIIENFTGEKTVEFVETMEDFFKCLKSQK